MAKRSKAGTVGELGSVHKMFTEFLAHRLKETNPKREFAKDELVYNDETGEYEEPFVYPMTTQEMGVIAKFLKDNDITCEPDDATLGDLKDEFSESFDKKRELKAQSILAQSDEERAQVQWLT